MTADVLQLFKSTLLPPSIFNSSACSENSTYHQNIPESSIFHYQKPNPNLPFLTSGFVVLSHATYNSFSIPKKSDLHKI